MRLFLIALAVAYVIMVSFVEGLSLAPKNALSSTLSGSAHNISAYEASAYNASAYNASAGNLAATPLRDGAAIQAATGAPCATAQSADQHAAGGCVEQTPRGR